MFTIIINQILKMVLLLLLGVICYRLKFIDQAGNKMLANLLLMIINPALIFMALQVDYTPELISGFLLMTALAIITHLLAIFIARLLISQKENQNYAIERFSIIYPNCGFIGIPLIQSVLGSEGVFYLSAYLVVFNVFSWTHGVVLMQGKTSLKELKKGLLSPTIIACVLGLLLFFLQIRVPAVLADTLNYISGMNTPMAMIIAGVSVAQTDLNVMLKNKRVYLITFCKLLLIPTVVLALLTPLHVPMVIACTLVIVASCPVATTCTAFCLRFQKNYKYSSELYAFTTVCSLFTIPLFVYAAEHLLG